MSARSVAALGGAGSFALAGVAGVLGNQITKDALWAWFAFAAVLVLGALVTGWAANRSAADDASAQPGGVVSRGGNVTVGDVSGGTGSQVAGVNDGTMIQVHRDEDP